MAKGLFRRNGRYSVRRIIPLDLQALYGRREIVKSLGTADPKEARLRHARTWVVLDEEFEATRRHYTLQGDLRAPRMTRVNLDVISLHRLDTAATAPMRNSRYAFSDLIRVRLKAPLPR